VQFDYCTCQARWYVGRCSLIVEFVEDCLIYMSSLTHIKLNLINLMSSIVFIKYLFKLQFILLTYKENNFNWIVLQAKNCVLDSSLHVYQVSESVEKFAHLTHNQWICVRLEFLPNQRYPLFHWARNYPHCLVLVGSQSGFKHDLHELTACFTNYLK